MLLVLIAGLVFTGVCLPNNDEKLPCIQCIATAENSYEFRQVEKTYSKKSQNGVPGLSENFVDLLR